CDCPGLTGLMQLSWTSIIVISRERRGGARHAGCSGAGGMGSCGQRRGGARRAGCSGAGGMGSCGQRRGGARRAGCSGAGGMGSCGQRRGGVRRAGCSGAGGMGSCGQRRVHNLQLRCTHTVHTNSCAPAHMLAHTKALTDARKHSQTNTHTPIIFHQIIQCERGPSHGHSDRHYQRQRSPEPVPPSSTLIRR
uniref:Uncharacterized protein n=1 Tax=Salmo trutta TaxID=8032 RepID=A0A674ARS3_SALTR